MNPRVRHWLKNLAIRSGSIKVLRKVRDTIAPPTRIDYRLLERTGEVPVPSSVTIEATLACNLHCTMCFQNDYRDRGIAKELGTDGLLQVLHRLPPQIRFAYFLGGEVFLRKGFPRLLETVDAQGIEAFTLDKHWGCRGSLVIDARIKPHHAPPLIEDPAVTRRVDALAASGGPLSGII